MNAEQAREITEQNKITEETLSKQIESAAKRGECEVALFTQIDIDMVTKLLKQGYMVSQSKSPDGLRLFIVSWL